MANEEDVKIVIKQKGTIPVYTRTKIGGGVIIVKHDNTLKGTGTDVTPLGVSDEVMQTIEEIKKKLPKYLSVERLDSYIFKITFDSIPEYDPDISFLSEGACSSFVKNGKLHRNFDWYYDNTASFEVVCKDFQGMASITGLNDGSLNVQKMEQLPYHMVDGVNKNGIMVSTHVLYNDWEYSGAGSKDQDIMLLPYYILSNLHSISDIQTVLGNYVSNIKIPEALANAEYLLQFVVTDGTTTYCIMPPESNTGSYVIQNITSNPKLTNFRWVDKETVVRTELQERPTGVERWNEVATSELEYLRFTKCYEEPTRLSEFIGIDHTTKDSTDEELLVIYNKAHAAYQTRTRDGNLWQTVHSIVFGKDGIEHLWCQENWDKDYITSGNVEDVRLNGVSVVTDKIANIDLSWGKIIGNLSDQADLNDELTGLSDRIGDTEEDISDIQNTIDGYGDIVTHNASEFQPAGDYATTGELNDLADIVDQEIQDRQDADDSLQEQIDNLKARGRYLSQWDATTGLPATNPTELPYQYLSGDYFIVGNVGETNYKPTGTSYDGTASTAIETEELAIEDVYFFDGNVWHLQKNTQKTVSFANLAGSPYDNINLSEALDDKVNVSDLGNGTLTIKQDGKSIGVFSANQKEDVEVNIEPLKEIDGGFASAVYLSDQVIDGGNVNGN